MQALDQQSPVGQVRQAVVVGQMVNTLFSLLLGGDVLLDPQIVGDDASGVADRADDGKLDVIAAVLAPVVELARPDLAGYQGLPKADVGLGRGHARLQDARVLPDDLVAGVARIAQEGLVDVFDAAGDVGDGDAFRALLDGERELPDPVNEGLLLGAIAQPVNAVGHVVGQLIE